MKEFQNHKVSKKSSELILKLKLYLNSISNSKKSYPIITRNDFDTSKSFVHFQILKILHQVEDSIHESNSYNNEQKKFDMKFSSYDYQNSNILNSSIDVKNISISEISKNSSTNYINNLENIMNIFDNLNILIMEYTSSFSSNHSYQDNCSCNNCQLRLILSRFIDKLHDSFQIISSKFYKLYESKKELSFGESIIPCVDTKFLEEKLTIEKFILSFIIDMKNKCIQPSQKLSNNHSNNCIIQ